VIPKKKRAGVDTWTSSITTQQGTTLNVTVQAPAETEFIVDDPTCAVDEHEWIDVLFVMNDQKIPGIACRKCPSCKPLEQVPKTALRISSTASGSASNHPARWSKLGGPRKVLSATSRVLFVFVFLYAVGSLCAGPESTVKSKFRF
jgi:hypothetical protein